MRRPPPRTLAILGGVGVGTMGLLYLALRPTTAYGEALPTMDPSTPPGPPPVDPSAPPGPVPVPYPGNPHDGDGGGAHRTPPGTRYATVRTPVFPDRQTFVVDTAAALEALGLTPVSAGLYVAHLARETGWGLRGMWNNAVGNVKQFGSGPWHRLSDGEPYVTYLTYADGVAANVALVRDHARYAGAWAKLVDGDRTWYGDLGREGYYESPPATAQAEYNGELARISSYLGVPL